MSLLQIIESARATSLLDEDGNQVVIELLAGMSAQQMQTWERSLTCQLPGELKGLLVNCRGFTGSFAEMVDFTGQYFNFEITDLIPQGFPIASDGCGNFWVVDLAIPSDDIGPIYFVSHDPPVILYQTNSLRDFLVELFRMNVPPYESRLSDASSRHTNHVWRNNPGLISSIEARVSEDLVVQSFAGTLDGDWLIADLRHASIGTGFSWGRYGPNTELRRAGIHPVFAYRRPKGLLAKIFDR